ALITNGFKRLGRILNIIGAIDSSHIPIKAPHLFPGYSNLSLLIVPYKDIGKGLIKQQSYTFPNKNQSRTGFCFISFEIVLHVITACYILHNICEERHDFLPLGEQYNDTGTGVNNELNISETSEGNIRNAIYDSLWNNYQRRNLSAV
ncbi:hypothetical protein C1646_769653, partial [Rhizophagus diaphanus]